MGVLALLPLAGSTIAGWSGQISLIAAQALGRVATSFPDVKLAGTVVGAKEPVYRVDVRLDRQTIDIDGEALPLQAGEQLTAHIVVDRRRILDWLLAPLHKLREIS